jgi:hypothetical protein
MERVGQKNWNKLPWLGFRLQWGCRRWRGVLWGYSPPPVLNWEKGWGVRWSSGWWWWLCLPAKSVPLLLLLFFSTYSPPLSTHSQSSLQPTGGLCNFVHGRLRACSGWESQRRLDLSRLAEFQTPTIFNCAFNFHHSIFYRSPKIMKIILYILYIYKNVSTNLIKAIPICEFVYTVILFQNYKISIYIKNMCRFWNSVNRDYKIQSHSK